MMKIIRHDKGTLYIGPFWMGTPEQIAQTQDAIDEEISLYYESSSQEDKNDGNKHEESRND